MLVVYRHSKESAEQKGDSAMTKIYCKEEKRGQHEFYIVVDKDEYYLFSQNYRAGVDSYYRGGVQLNKGICHGMGKTDCAIHRTMDKLKKQIRYIEQEYDLAILKQTKMRAA